MRIAGLQQIICAAVWIMLRTNVAGAEALVLKPALDSITHHELRQHIEFLASDTLEGREAGTAGSQAAAAYVVDVLKKTALLPAGDDGAWYQHFRGNLRNIVAEFPGADDSLKQQFILVGAHYDHIGYGSSSNSRGPIGQVHNGADDNASGAASVLEIIEALSALDVKLRRPLLFVFWDGEEKGLLGSRYFVAHPIRPLDQIRMAINVDMLGRLRPTGLEVYGWRTAADLRRFVAIGNRARLKLSFPWPYVADSDHWPFFEAGIPSLMLHTGKHDDYHRPSDDCDRINYDGLHEATRFVLELIAAAANTDELPEFRSKAKSELPTLAELARGTNENGSHPPPARLGIQFDSRLAKDGVVKLTRVDAGTAADLAGLRIGDEIVEFAGQPVTAWPDFRTLVMTAENQSLATIRRQSELRNLLIKLTGDRVAIGIGWRNDDAEPGAIIVSRVVEASPADLAGIKPGYRIHRICGQTATDDASCLHLLLHSPNPVVLDVEHDGLFETVSLKRVDAAKSASQNLRDGMN